MGGNTASSSDWVALWNLSPALCLVVVIAFVTWRIAKWVRPFVERAFEAHIDLVHNLDKNTAINTETLGEIRDHLLKQNGG